VTINRPRTRRRRTRTGAFQAVRDPAARAGRHDLAVRQGSTGEAGRQCPRVALPEAEGQAAIRSEDFRTAMQTVVVDARLRGHDQQALSKERAEPEMLREWFAALTTGKTAVALVSGGGAAALRVLQLGVIAGLVGLSVQSSGTLDLIEHAKTLELGLIAGRTKPTSRGRLRARLVRTMLLVRRGPWNLRG